MGLLLHVDLERLQEGFVFLLNLARGKLDGNIEERCGRLLASLALDLREKSLRELRVGRVQVRSNPDEALAHHS
jgi:hypothetical protein